MSSVVVKKTFIKLIALIATATGLIATVGCGSSSQGSQAQVAAGAPSGNVTSTASTQPPPAIIPPPMRPCTVPSGSALAALRGQSFAVVQASLTGGTVTTSTGPAASGANIPYTKFSARIDKVLESRGTVPGELTINASGYYQSVSAGEYVLFLERSPDGTYAFSGGPDGVLLNSSGTLEPLCDAPDHSLKQDAAHATKSEALFAELAKSPQPPASALPAN